MSLLEFFDIICIKSYFVAFQIIVIYYLLLINALFKFMKF